MIIGVFIDANNLYYCVGKKFGGKKLDYSKYNDSFQGEGIITYRSIVYGTQVDNEAVRFISCLKHLGFETKYKKLRQTEKKEIKRINWNVGITLDVVRIVLNNKLDTVVLGSSDIELLPLVEWVKERGVRVVIHACGIPNDLKNAADSCKEIGEEVLETTSTTE